jgi:hypothetical protein
MINVHKHVAAVRKREALGCSYDGDKKGAYASYKAASIPSLSATIVFVLLFVALQLWLMVHSSY